jgi:hypothetical protein
MFINMSRLKHIQKANCASYKRGYLPDAYLVVLHGEEYEVTWFHEFEKVNQTEAVLEMGVPGYNCIPL